MLFISHAASRTGAPIVLLHFLQWLRRHSSGESSILLKQGGRLRAEFCSAGKTCAYWELDRRVRRNLSQRVLRKAGLAYQEDYCFRPLNDVYRQGDIDVILSNTATNGSILRDLNHLQCPVITYVHELDRVLARQGRENMDLVLQHTDHFVACSLAVDECLRERWGVKPGRISILHEFIDTGIDVDPRSCDAKRRDLGIPENAFVLGAAGYDTWRKGKDLFLVLARAVVGSLQGKEVHFVWVGGDASGREYEGLRHDISRSGLSGLVHLVSEVSDPLCYYGMFDVFCMTSREDPYPLVNLEVASLGIPIICFNGAGGSSEFVEDDAGICVPYLAVDEMAQGVLRLYRDAGLRSRLGERAREKVRRRHDVSVACPKLLALLARHVAIGGDPERIP